MEEENLWYKKLGFYNNPFSIKPAPFDFKVFGQDKILEDLSHKIPSGSVTFIEGTLGTGKTTILKHIINKFKGKKQVIYFACNRIEKELNIEQLLIGKYGFWGRLFKIHPRDMIVLLDEAQELSNTNTERIKYFFDQGNIKSVVFTGTSYESTNFHDGIKQRIGQDGIFKTKDLTDKEALALIKNRIRESTILSEDIIKKLYKISNKNPRTLLQNCDKACKYAIDNEESEFKEEHFKKVFKEDKETKEKKTKDK